MPGTIRISVLDIQNLPSSSPTSSTSIKVTMGRKEYQTSENPVEFSIPLTTLRDNLVFHILDADGNEIAHTEDVETRLVVEKGDWDDHFPLEGGGFMHLKMHFVLSDEEHNRIRMMRLSALKKTHGQLLNSSSKGSKSASNIGRSSNPLLGHGDHSSGGLQVGLLDIKAASTQGDPGKSRSGVSRVARLTHTINPSNTDGNKTASPVNPSDSVGGSLTRSSPKNIVQKIGVRSPPKAAPIISPEAEEVLSLPPGSNTANAAKDISVTSKLEKGVAHTTEMQGTLERSPSNVRKMISVFENSSAQDMLPHTKTLSTKPQSSKTVTEVPTSNQKLKESKPDSAKPAESMSKKVHSLYKMAKGEQAAPRTIDGATYSHYSGSEDVTVRKNEGLVSTLRRKFSFQREARQKEEERSTEVLRRNSTSEIASTSGKLHKESLSRFKYPGLLGKHQDPDRNLDIDNGKGIRWKDSWKSRIQRTSTSSLKCEIQCGNGATSSEMSRAWIFPDEPRKPCVITGGEQVMLCMEESTCPRKTNSLVPEKLEETFGRRKNDNKENKGEMTLKKQRNPEADRPENVDIFAGPVGQVMKVVIIVGFGLLVLMTRQKNNR